MALFSEMMDEAGELRDEITRLRWALEFYADFRRYEGANQRPLEDDPYSKPDAAYIQDVTRDRGGIARAALHGVVSSPQAERGTPSS